MAASYDGSIRIDTKIDQTGAATGLATLTKSLKGFAGLVVSAFAVKAIVEFGGACIELASDLNEIQNVVDTTFGSSSSAINSFASTAMTQFGLSELAAKRYTGTMGAMLKSMGLNSDAATDMSIEMAGLAGDLASFYNLDTDEAFDKIRSGISGETEPLKQLGINLSEANLSAYALSQGITTAYSSMSEQNKALLRYNYLMSVTTDAQGDFAKTSGSWANQVRVLKLQWDSFKASLGQAFISVLTPVVQFLNNLLSRINAVASAFSGLFKSVSGSSQTASAAVASVADATTDLTAATVEATKATNSQQASIDELNVISDDSDKNTASTAGTSNTEVGKGTTVSPDVQTSIDAIQDMAKKFNDYITTSFSPSFDAWSSAFNNLKEPVSNALNNIKDSVKSLWAGSLRPAASYILHDWIPSIANGFSTTFAPIFSDVAAVAVDEFAKDFTFVLDGIGVYINDIWTPTMDFFKQVALDAFDGISKAWDNHGAGILDKFTTFKQSLRDIWSSLYDNVFAPLFGYLYDNLGWLWDNHLKPLWDNIAEFFGSLSEFTLTLWNHILAPLINWLIATFGPAVSGVLGVIFDVVGTLVGYMADIISAIFKMLSGLMDFLTGVFTGDWGKAWGGIKKIVGGVWDGIWALIKGVVNLIIDGINLLWSGVYTVIRGIVNSVGSVAGALGDVFGKDWHFSMPAEVPKIPKLAAGAVIPPNREFIATLGDQKSGMNIETPEALLRKIMQDELDTGALAELLQKLLDAVTGLSLEVKLYANDREIAKSSNRGNNSLGYPIATT